MRKRAAFTLVEMLVSMALILFIMVLLTQAFSTGLQVFRQLKGLGDMEEHLRSTAQILRRDLSAYHFENTKRLSDLNFWTEGPPQQGFFRIWQGSPSQIEGQDGDGLPSLRATDHILHFTSKLTGQGPGDFATSSIPSATSLFPAAAANLVNAFQDNRFQVPGQFRGRWFEVVYFLRPNQLRANGTGAQLFTLYRRQLGILDSVTTFPSITNQLNTPTSMVSVTDGSSLGTQPPVTPAILGFGTFSEIACKKTKDIQTLNPPSPGLYPDTIRFSSPADLTMPSRRFGMLPANPAGPLPYELAGVPNMPFLAASDARIPISGRSYPFYGEIPDPRSPWNVATGAPYFASPPPWQGNASLQGADLMLSDVISFDVQVLVPQATDFNDLGLGNNPVFANSGTRVFDTWSSQNDGVYDYSNYQATGSATSIPHTQISIQALKITIRIWDPKTLQARQITIIQDM